MCSIRWSHLPGQPPTERDKGVRRTARRAQPEYDQQVRLFTLIELLASLHPARADELEDVWATGNGGKRPPGAAGMMREAGQRKGVPDVLCLVPSGPAHGLAIEMKSAIGRLTAEQSARLARLAARGYRTSVERTWQDAGRLLCAYLGIPWPDQADTKVEWLLASRKAERKRLRKNARRNRLSGQNATSWPRVTMKT